MAARIARRNLIITPEDADLLYRALMLVPEKLSARDWDRIDDLVQVFGKFKDLKEKK